MVHTRRQADDLHPKLFSDSRNARGVRLDHQTTTKGQNPAAFSLPTYLSVYFTVTLSPLKPSGLPCDSLQEAVFLSLKRKKNKGVGGRPIQSASFWRHALYVLQPPPLPVWRMVLTVMFHQTGGICDGPHREHMSDNPTLTKLFFLILTSQRHT